jgi:hypothetical protein
MYLEGVGGGRVVLGFCRQMPWIFSSGGQKRKHGLLFNNKYSLVGPSVHSYIVRRAKKC